MNIRKRILLLASLLLLVSVGGIVNIVWQLPRIEQMHDLKTVFHILILLGLFGAGLIFSVLELVRQEIINPIFQLATQLARLKARKIDGHRLELTGSKEIDLLTRVLNDLLDGFEKEENLYRIFPEASPDMIFLLDREGRILFGNLNAARQWNYQIEEIIGKRQEELFSPDIAARHKQAVEKIFNSGQPVFIDIHETIGHHQCWIDARMVPVLNKDGRVTAVLGISRDISERKKAEEALKESEAKYKVLFTGAPEGILVADLQTRQIRYANPAACKMFGYTEEEFMRLDVMDIHPKESLDHMLAEFKAPLRGETRLSSDLPCLRKDGALFYVNINDIYMVLDGRECNVGFFTDITGRKQAEERLERVNRCLLNLGPDFNANVGSITALSGELLNGTCALYNRLKDGRLCALGQWRTPPDFPPRDIQEGHICYDVIHGPGELLFIPDLHKTRYAETDPNVRRYGFQSYLGQPVHCGSVIIGSLCVAFQHAFTPTENDKRLLSILASALGVEESRHLAEEKLRETQKKFQDLVETLRDWVWEVDTLGHYTYVGPRVKDILGYETKELLNKTPFDLMPAEEARRMADVFKQLSAEQKPIITLENINLHKDGHQVVLETNALPFYDTEGNFKGYRGTDRDITKRKRAEEALRESEEIFSQFMKYSPVYVFFKDENIKAIRLSENYTKMLGRPISELLGKNMDDLFPSDFAKSMVADDKRVINEGKKVEVEEELNGRFYSTIKFPVYRKGKPACLAGFTIDTTERKQAEEKAVMLSDAIENAHHGCLVVSQDYKVVFANDYAFTKIGFDFDELKENDLFSLCADREQVKDIIETVKVTKRWMGEIAVVKKDGGQFPALVSVTAFGADSDASDREGNIILFQDITIQKEMREKLLTSEKLAVMGRLTADVAHELNNPLAIVIGGTQLVLSRLDEKAQTTFKSQLETVLRNGRRCKTILSNLLGYGRTIGKKEEAVNLPDLVREAIDNVNYQHDMSAIEKVLNYGEIASAEIIGNRSALLSVFVNLIRNARQAMGEKGRLTITIEKEDKKHLRIEICDTGLGMSKDQKSKLFKPFTSGWKAGEGSGLGLATSLGIIEMHGGSMTAESEGPGKGAAFTILLPCEFKGKK